jgi:hypothetical protein
MGRTSSLEIVFDEQNTDLFLEALSRHITPEDYSTLRTIQDEGKLFNMQRDICLTFLIDTDEFTEPLQVGNHVEGKIAMGCVWSNFLSDASRVRFSATSATRDMAEAFQESAVIREVFTKMAVESSAESLSLIDDWNDSTLLWEKERAG